MLFVIPGYTSLGIKRMVNLSQSFQKRAYAELICGELQQYAVFSSLGTSLGIISKGNLSRSFQKRAYAGKRFLKVQV